MKEALYYKKLKNKTVQCQLCPHFCTLEKNKVGKCRVRQNIDGTLYSLVYGKACSIAMDPIEKKPLYRFLPGTKTLSIATVGCNLSCLQCFTGNTIINMNDSIETFEKIFENSKKEIIKDNIITKEPDIKVATLSGGFNKAKKIFGHYYKGQITIIKPAFLPYIECTPDHKIYCFKDGELIKTCANDLKKGDKLAIPKIKCGNKKTIKISEIIGDGIIKYKKKLCRGFKNLYKILEMKNHGSTSKQIGINFGFHPVYVRALLAKYKKKGESLFEEEIILNNKKGYIKFKFGKKKRIKDEIPLNEELASLLGYYCAEGTVTKSKNRPNSYNISFCIGKHEIELEKEIKQLFDKIFGIELVTKNERTAKRLYCGSNIISLFFKKLCGNSAYEKKVPEPIFEASEKTIRAFIHAYNKGDGWTKGKNHPISMDTVSQKLAYGIYSLFLRIGILPFYYKYNPPNKKVIEGRKVNQSPLYYIKIYNKKEISKFYSIKTKGIIRKNFEETKTHFLIPIKNIYNKNFSGFVYNFEVEKEHSYTANFIAVKNCQNYEISQAFPTNQIPTTQPKKIIETALKEKCPSISYTYSEPTIAYEYVLSIAKLAKKNKLKNIIVSNGFINSEPLKKLCKYLDAANIDIKAFTEGFYKKVCKSSLKPVLEALKILKENNIHIEITNLIIPTLNDSPQEIEKMCKWIKENLGEKTPLHFTRFFPMYQMKDIPTTPIETLEMAKQIGDKYLKYVYLGNV